MGKRKQRETGESPNVREVPSGTGRKERNVPRMRHRGKMRVKMERGEKKKEVREEGRDLTVPEKKKYSHKKEQRVREWNLDLILCRSVEVSFAVLSQWEPRRTSVEYAITHWMKILTSCFGQFLLTTCFRASLAFIKAISLLNESQWWHLIIFSYTNSLNSIEINANPPSEATASRKTRAVSNCCGAVTGKAGTYNGTLGTEVSTQNNPEISMCNFDQKCLESLSVELLLLLESYF